MLPAKRRVLGAGGGSAPLPDFFTTKEPVAAPAATVHKKEAIAFPFVCTVFVRVHIASAVLKPLALKMIVLSPVPFAVPLSPVSARAGTVTVKKANTILWGI